MLSVLSHLDQLRGLSLRGAPSTAVPHILTLLPHLRFLDTDYNPSIAKGRPPELPLISKLQGLTVRTTVGAGPNDISGWIKKLAPYPSLESFKLLGFSVNGDNDLPRRFILDMAQIHGQLLKQFHVTGASLSWPDVQCVCAMFPMIEDLSVLIFTNDIVSPSYHDHEFSVTDCSVQTLIDEAVLEAKNLRTLSVEVGMASWKASRNKFSVEEAKEMMIRDGSRLREIRVAGISYQVRHPFNPRQTENNVIHRAAGYRSSIPKMALHTESSGYHKTIAEDRAAGMCNLMCIALSSRITLFRIKDGTRLMVKSIVVDVGMVATVRDLVYVWKNE